MSDSTLIVISKETQKTPQKIDKMQESVDWIYTSPPPKPTSKNVRPSILNAPLIHFGNYATKLPNDKRIPNCAFGNYIFHPKDDYKPVNQTNMANNSSILKTKLPRYYDSVPPNFIQLPNYFKESSLYRTTNKENEQSQKATHKLSDQSDAESNQIQSDVFSWSNKSQLISNVSTVPIIFKSDSSKKITKQRIRKYKQVCKNFNFLTFVHFKSKKL